jgi:uncharacterized protein YecE (DUF72 family)
VARARIGCSGWTYDDWVGVLYPQGLPKARWRDAYAAEFDTVELNASFYRWPGTARFEQWARVLPPDFRMSVKAANWITHRRRLRDPDGAWARRLLDAWQALSDHRGPVLLQLPPDLERDDALLGGFLGSLDPRLEVAVELRHETWQTEEVYDLLERHGAAYVVMSGARLPCVLRATAPFVFVRLHGPSPTHLYAGSYSEDDLRWWADRIREWLDQGRDVWAYFNNDGHGHAVRNARTLRGLLGGDRSPPP